VNGYLDGLCGGGRGEDYPALAIQLFLEAKRGILGSGW
jgi:hypothetical protein